MVTDLLTRILNVVVIMYITTPFVCLLAAMIFYLAGGKIAQERFDKIIELSKWYIVSVAIVLTTKMIDGTFTERETGIKEMQVYDKYAETILKADNIEQRWKLVQYFSTVTPTERLRSRWLLYQEAIKNDYLSYVDLKKQEKKLLSQDTLSKPQIEKLATVQNKLEPFEKRLISTDQGNWVIVFTGDNNLTQAQYEFKQLNLKGINGARLFYRDNYYRAISRNFSSKSEAQTYLDQNKKLLRGDIYIVNLDSWCTNPTYNGQYFECK